MSGPLLYLKLEDFERQIAVNLTGPFIVTQAFAPLLGADRARTRPARAHRHDVLGRRAHRLRHSLGAYSAAKFGLEGLSESLRRELMLFGIDVVIINPGSVATPIWGKSEQVDAEFADTPFAPAIAKARAGMSAMDKAGLPPERIGEAVKTALTAAPPNVAISSTPTPIQDFLARTLPKRIVDSLVASRLGLKPAEAP